MVNDDDNLGPLCEDLLVNILFRLPERDLLKCKCASKEWHRIVSNVCVPRLSNEAPFSGVYFRLARDSEVPYVIISSAQDVIDQLHHLMAYSDSIHYIGTASLQSPLKPCGYYRLDGPCFAVMSYASLLPFDHRGADFLDCCNGLVLFVQRPKPQFFVCNPTIKQCVPIPLPPSSINLSSLYASLAFDPSESVEYKVVISSVSTRSQCLHVFYSQTGEWKTHEVKIELPTSTTSFELVRYSVYLKNVIYRLSMLYKILCFDLETMKTCVLDCPSEKSSPTRLTHVKGRPPPGCLGVSNGFLSYVTDEDGYVCVWLLDKPNKSSEWTLSYKICSHYLWESVSKECSYPRQGWLGCCGIHPTSDILFISCATSMLMYHMGSGCVEIVRYLAGCGVMHCGLFFPIFLHKIMYVTLKNWCRRISSKIDNYEDVQDRWCYIEQ